ncbi:fork head transcription factor 1 [Phyllosticta citriasiana]|uniref:Fork head transcription factor 1 n=1 Tax=Phyllosticta citriasiana TaxID=595635 RepID=A0ABR1KYS9_9PEZI
MPPRGGRGGGRGAKREAVAQEQSDTPNPADTPTRKKRRLNNNDVAETAAPPRPSSAQSDRTIGSDYEADFQKSTPEELLTQVVPMLKVAHYTTNAQVDLSNELQKRDPVIAQRGSTQAYAKIEGHSWVYFAKSTTILIGRGEHGTRNQANGSTPTNSQNNFDTTSQQPSADAQVNIDLGPDKQVSRLHAWIEYEPTDGHWFIIVNGRNGLKLDDRTLSRGERVRLHSGAIINVCGTDMIFVCPGEELRIHPMIWTRSKQGEAGDGEGGHDDSFFHAHNHQDRTADNHGLPASSQFNQTAPSQQQSNSNHDQYQQAAPTSGPLAPNTPIPSRIKQSPKIKTSPSAAGAYSRGVMLESTEHIDYSADSAKDLKPPLSYAQLIGQAIMSSPEEQLTLANIYEYIKKHYAFYRYNGGGWQNSIRHNLSLSKHFEKVARRTDEPGKGMKWRLVPEERENFLKKGIHTKKHRMGSSGPNSPAIAQATERLHGAVEVQTPSQPSKFQVKESPRSVTPPLASYPTANESYTPDRGPQPPRAKAFFKDDQVFTPINDRKHDVASFPPASTASFGAPTNPESNVRATAIPSDSKDNEPGPTPRVGRSSLEITYSPPATNGYKSSGLNDLPDSAFNGLVTPLVAKNRPHLAPPSTAKMPSQYCYLSSPAPFWKFADLGSTPARNFVDSSPTKEAKPFRFGKAEEEDDEDEDEEEEKQDDGEETGPMQPSSPPVLGVDVDRSREGSRDGSGSGEGESQDLSPATPTRPSSRRFNTAEEAAVKKQLPAQFEGDDKEEGIDLMKGFQGIGSFHRGLTQSAGFIRRS